MDNIAYTNLLSLKFWVKVKEYWNVLSVASKAKWLDQAIIITQDAFKVAAAGTNAVMPETYDDFKFTTSTYPDGVWNYKMLYATYSKKCKNTWNNVVINQILATLMEEYAYKSAKDW